MRMKWDAMVFLIMLVILAIVSLVAVINIATRGSFVWF